ncbi:MAG: hypothetical protein L0K92_04535, partial [Enterobacterales bacterium]|nr:hypothetical protein [Enterobacterales bacterium]
RPQPATSIPAGGSKMYPFNMKRRKAFLPSCLLVFLSSCLFYFFDSLSLGSESGENRMFSLGEEAPRMAHADPARRWHLG